ncbi:uncharacterized protein [Epargyreus clarus]|uniref:uncharacterized protein isoform X2 n=1 Tax=Epargyreus clarus TaxID=520877 RepID=UPI003C2B0A17
MCDMQKMPTRDDASCDEDSEMNFAAAFSAVNAGGTHFVTTGGQIPVTKIQQNVANNGGLQQVVGMVGGMGMGEGVQFVRAIDGSTALQAAPQLISVPIALQGHKPGDPQPTVQIQVLSPNLTLQQQQPKYQMQIPIQGFQQGAVLTVAYSPDGNETGGIQLLGNSLPEGLQMVTALPQEMQLVHQQENKEQVQQALQHQILITPNHQIVIKGPDDSKALNNNTSSDNNNAAEIIIKEECDEMTNDDDKVVDTREIHNFCAPIITQRESSQGTEEGGDTVYLQLPHSSEDLGKYLSTLPPQQMQQLPLSLRQFLRLNPIEGKKSDPGITLEVTCDDEKKETFTVEDDGSLRIQSKKKKKYKKKPSKPARPKPGQVVIATAADGTAIYCCPECQMAYPEKEQLELHLSVHKIERRFICGVCGAGLKRKEHLERHKLGHNPERPFVCGVCRKGFKRREHLNLHTVIHSGVKTEMCGECGKGFYRKDHLRKHTRSHESKRARGDAAEERPLAPAPAPAPQQPAAAAPPQQQHHAILPEITIHVPTSANMQVPVQINIPQHVVSSLQQAHAQAQAAAAAAAEVSAGEAQAQLDALLAQHS